MGGERKVAPRCKREDACCLEWDSAGLEKYMEEKKLSSDMLFETGETRTLMACLQRGPPRIAPPQMSVRWIDGEREEKRYLQQHFRKEEKQQGDYNFLLRFFKRLLGKVSSY